MNVREDLDRLCCEHGLLSIYRIAETHPTRNAYYELTVMRLGSGLLPIQCELERQQLGWNRRELGSTRPDGNRGAPGRLVSMAELVVIYRCLSVSPAVRLEGATRLRKL